MIRLGLCLFFERVIFYFMLYVCLGFGDFFRDCEKIRICGFCLFVG